LISIATDIAYHNPKTYANSATILSKFISLIEDDEHKREIINKIKKKFDHIPNTGHLQIWLQRITIKFDKSYDYEETLCKAVAGGSPQIWNSEWLSPTIAGMMQAEKIIDQEKIEMLPPVISNSEVELFTSKFIY